MVVAFAVLRWEDGRVRLTNYKCVSEGAGFVCLLSISSAAGSGAMVF